MLPALIHGKLSRGQENMEDILTSNVFGVLRYLPPQDGLAPFMAQAENLEGRRPLACLAEAPIHRVSYEFWPWWQEAGCIGCQPDLVITIALADGRTLLVLVEAKYLSGKSTEADESQSTPTDQLAREWDNLHRRAGSLGSTPILVYLTADVGMPVSDMRDAIQEYQSKRSRAMDGLAWLSWRALGPIVEGRDHPVHHDLTAMLSRLGLSYFAGIPALAPLGERVDCFGRLFGWDVRMNSMPVEWRFSA